MIGLAKISTKKRIWEESGFTLIELLVVVAIIAIISAIAVPHIMSANIRAKIKVVNSDMGSIAIALEDYKIDHGYYPLQNTVPDAIKDDGTFVGLGKLIYPTTFDNTPVYLTSIPKDPFNDDPDPGGYYSYFTTGDPTAPTAWALVSYGPDKDRDINSYAEAKEAWYNGVKRYNSDEGITSSGDIVIIGPYSTGQG